MIANLCTRWTVGGEWHRHANVLFGVCWDVALTFLEINEFPEKNLLELCGVVHFEEDSERQLAAVCDPRISGTDGCS